MAIPLLTSLLSILANLSEIQWGNLKTFGEYLFWWRNGTHIYKVLDNQIELEIVDTKGKTAHFYKQKHVKFLRNNISSFLDTAWGNGNIFVNYMCSPGTPVDFYEEGYRHRILISLRETKQKGDEVEFHIQRTIKDGYTEPTGYLQTDITYPTKHLSVCVIFPKKRIPKAIFIIEKNSKNTIKVKDDQTNYLPDGRYQVEWQKKNPRLHESYILSWKW